MIRIGIQINRLKEWHVIYVNHVMSATCEASHVAKKLHGALDIHLELLAPCNLQGAPMSHLQVSNGFGTLKHLGLSNDEQVFHRRTTWVRL